MIEPAAAPLPTFASFAEAAAFAEHVRVQAESDQGEVLRLLAGRGWDVTADVVYGPAARTLAAEAVASRAEVLIVGATAHEAGGSDDLSVARDLLDRAPCPVIVARRHVISRIVFGTDGSAGARKAEEHLVESPALAGLPILVVSVAETRHLIAAKLRPALGLFDADEIESRRALHGQIAVDAAARLAGHGLDARADVRVGDVAAEIGAAVAASGADIVVLGSDDHRGLSRIVLGSVARDVIAQTDASVLVVRPRAPASAIATDRRLKGPVHAAGEPGQHVGTQDRSARTRPRQPDRPP